MRNESLSEDWPGVLCRQVYHYESLGSNRAGDQGRWELGVMELYEGAESILSAEKVVDVIRGNTRTHSLHTK